MRCLQMGFLGMVTVTLPTVAVIYGVMSIVTFALYWIDKRRAVKGRWRITENMLHGCELLGGWPGALAGQRILRHKNRKTKYQVIYWMIVVLHIAFWVWWWN